MRIYTLWGDHRGIKIQHQTELEKEKYRGVTVELITANTRKQILHFRSRYALAFGSGWSFRITFHRVAT